MKFAGWCSIAFGPLVLIETLTPVLFSDTLDPISVLQYGAGLVVGVALILGGALVVRSHPLGPPLAIAANGAFMYVLLTNVDHHIDTALIFPFWWLVVALYAGLLVLAVISVARLSSGRWGTGQTEQAPQPDAPQVGAQ